MLKKLSEKIGFTFSELAIISFLLAVLLFGTAAKFFIQSNNSFDYKTFSYAHDDSLFFSDYSGIDSSNAIGTSDSLSKSNVLGFKSRDFSRIAPKSIPGDNSIGLNKSGITDPTLVPGIGKVTAKNIIELRNKRGKFSNLDELLDVKGIGDKKFNKIKRYFYID